MTRRTFNAASYTAIAGANDRIRLGIIGPGARGTELIKEAIAIPGVELAMAADIYTARLREVTRASGAREFAKRRDGMMHAMDGGLWLHRHRWKGRPMVHLVSTNRERLLAYGRSVGIPESRLQYKPLKDPRTEQRQQAWHWDLGGPVLPPEDDTLKAH